jgi:arginase
MKKRNIHIIENPSELGAGVRGPALGPIAVRLEDNRLDNRIYGKFTHSTVNSLNHRLCAPTPFVHAKFLDAIVEHNLTYAESFQEILKSGKFPIVMSGDHSNALGTIAGIKNMYPEKRLGVIWIDAHADLHTPFTSPSGNVHGMPLGASLGEGYASDAINVPDDKTVQLWSELTHLGSHSIHPKIHPSDLVFIAIRDLEDQEWKDIDENHIKYYVPARLLNKSMKEVAEETLSHLSSCDMIYVSFDVDSMDPSVSKGTGTSVDNGLSLEQAKKLLTHFFEDDKTVCLEVTEVNPLIDVENRMAKAALDILTHLLG